MRMLAYGEGVAELSSSKINMAAKTMQDQC